MYRPYEQKDRSFKWHLNNYVFGLYTLVFKRLGSVRFFHFVFFQYFFLLAVHYCKKKWWGRWRSWWRCLLQHSSDKVNVVPWVQRRWNEPRTFSVSHTCSHSTIGHHLLKMWSSQMVYINSAILVNEHDQTYCGVEAGSRQTIDYITEIKANSHQFSSLLGGPCLSEGKNIPTYGDLPPHPWSGFRYKLPCWVHHQHPIGC